MTIEAVVTRVFKTSIETHINVWAENLPTRTKYKCNEAYYTFVALDSRHNPVAVPELLPETEDDVKKFEGALRRRQVRLVLAGRMKPEEATELKNLFLDIETKVS